MNVIRSILVLLLCGLSAACATKSTQPLPPLQVVPGVDLAKYAGTWHEIARFPHSFQEGCVGSTATYSLRDDGKIGVVNQCRKGSADGELSTAKGTAWVVDEKTNAKLKVSFFWPFSGDYWIIDLGKEYDYAVVGHPSRTYLWILSRAPAMNDPLYNEILDRLRAQSYDTTRLIRTSPAHHMLLPAR